MTPPLVLLHAFPVDARMWGGVRPLLGPGRRVFAPDQRGLGGRPLTRDGDVPQPDLDVVADDVLAELDAQGVRRVVVGGCSMGGYVAMALLRRAPGRVAGLVLVGTRAGADGPEQRANRLRVADRLEREGATGWSAESAVEGLLGPTTRASRPEVVRAVRGWAREQSPAGVAWAQRAMASRRDSRALLAAATVPVLVVAGQEDGVVPVGEHRALAGDIAGSALRVVPGAGHLAPVEDPVGFAGCLVPWLDEVASAGE
ncbi:alpha/beta hydrolase [Actinoalloteichus sp. AHMU CJ021]|uniref:Pimeloyl-ACP methyl ester carboxylesterase n=1 Tax=Actinoalloteichus caeruleus DSM 43889 TaxID=1120930 RepID=A0ABT1JPI3_ACTCY|nr:alpha/beta hydrolase [Actinoalloteichus caeruleus]AUS79876.1 alpha/beta hydrolase [Actinoalloteichus sp. AHMU CJ021]MCP2334048.1 Pimeloyl-ACP methyl ester carboxylesterase [Actinoalloteichus caeruleus DSM 43889]